MTIQNAPPGLDYDRDKKFSKVFVFFLVSFFLPKTSIELIIFGSIKQS